MHRMALHRVLGTHTGAARHSDGCQDRTADKPHNFVFHFFSFVLTILLELFELTNFYFTTHVLVATTVVGVNSRLRKREAEALAFAIQRRVKPAALVLRRDCGN